MVKVGKYTVRPMDGMGYKLSITFRNKINVTLFSGWVDAFSSSCCIWMTFMTPHDIKTYSLIDHVKLCVCIYMHCMLYIQLIYIVSWLITAYIAIDLNGIRDNDQQVLPCSVLSIPSMVWGALAWQLFHSCHEWLNLQTMYRYMHHSSNFCEKNNNWRCELLFLQNNVPFKFNIWCIIIFNIIDN